MMTLPVDPEIVEAAELLPLVLGDHVNRAIVEYVRNKRRVSFGTLSRALSAQGVADRVSAFAHTARLLEVGILEYELERGPGDIAFRSWIKMFTISGKHKRWIAKLHS